MGWPANCANSSSPKMYAASLRSGGAAGGQGEIRSNLYITNLARGNAQLVGSCGLPGGKTIAVTGIAAHPKSGVLYAITAETSPNNPNALVIVDPATAASSLVADLGVSVSDIAFDSKGVLWVWLPGTSRVGSVDLSSGAVVPLGRGGP